MNFYSTTPVETRTLCYCGRHWLDQRDGHQRQRWESIKREMALMRGQPRVFLSPMCILDGHVGQVWIVTKDCRGRPFPPTCKQAVLVCDNEQRVYCINKTIRRVRFDAPCRWCDNRLYSPRQRWCDACIAKASAAHDAIYKKA